MDTSTYLELKELKERVTALEEGQNIIIGALMEKGIIPKPKEEKKK